MAPRSQALAELFRSMLVIRSMEQRFEKLFRAGRLRGALHLAIGQEAVPVGACSVLQADDPMSFTYRSHGWALARGIPPAEVFAECFGREGGCSRGRGGSKHLADWARRVIPSNAIVGANLPLAVGTALATTLRGGTEVSVAVFGDGALNQAVVHEALTQAVVWHLPLVFVCENNLYAELTPVETFSPVAELIHRARGYDMPAAVCDGMDVEDVRRVIGDAVAGARSGTGPTFVEARTYRFCGHMTGDAQAYRDAAEVTSWESRDPLTVARGRLTEDGVTEAELDRIIAEVEASVTEAELVAWDSPQPDADDVYVGAPSWTVRHP